MFGIIPTNSYNFANLNHFGNGTLALRRQLNSFFLEHLYLNIILNSTQKNKGKFLLSAIEMKVAIQICEGATTKEIAASLALGAATINSHRNRIWKKLGIHKASELITYMVSKGYFRPKGS